MILFNKIPCERGVYYFPGNPQLVENLITIHGKNFGEHPENADDVYTWMAITPFNDLKKFRVLDSSDPIQALMAEVVQTIIHCREFTYASI